MLTNLSVLQPIEGHSSCRERTNCHFQPRRRAFTVIESVVTIAIIGIIYSIAIPSFIAARRASQMNTIQSDLKAFAGAMDQYHFEHQRYPSTSELVASGLLNNVWTSSISDGKVVIVKAGLDYCFIVEAANANTFILCAYPKPPYNSGSAAFCITNGGLIESLPPDEEALSLEKKQVELVALQVLDASARIIASSENPEEAAWTLPYMGTLDPQVVLANELDADRNGAISSLELHEYATPHAGDSGYVATVRLLLGQALTTLHLDGDDVPDVLVSELQGDPAAVFNAANFAILHEAIVSKPGVAEAFTAKVSEAESARLAGDLEENSEIIRAQRNHLRAQKGKSVSTTDAVLLDGLYRVLAPAPLPE